MIDNDYNKLVFALNNIILSKNLSGVIQPQDLISETYLNFHDNGLEYEYQLYIKKCCIQLREQSRTINHYQHNDEWNRIIKKDKNLRYCPSCKEDFPLTNFSIINNHKTGTSTYSAKCKKCKAKQSTEWNQKNRETHLIHRKNAKKNVVKNMPNSYIIHMLSKKYRIECITQKDIDRQRLHLYYKRKKLAKIKKMQPNN